MTNKKGISGVLVSILLVLLGIAAIAIISVNINTLIKSESAQISPTINCLDFQSSSIIKITNTCFNEESSEIEITLKRSFSDAEITQIDFILSSNSSSASFCCGLPDCDQCQVLGQGEQRVYFFPTLPSESFSNSIVSIGSCQLDTKTISKC